jgi:Zn-dependent metalloprotease
MRLSCGCYIVPKSVLDRFAVDASLPKACRMAFLETGRLEAAWRKLRIAHTIATLHRRAERRGLAPLAALAAEPAVSVFTCNGSESLPGAPIGDPAGSGDDTAKRTFNETKAVAKFYKEAFGRNSLDDQGLTLLSSIHYGRNYNNAFWNGGQMAYGDGDGEIFVDFTLSNDVIAHELTHGVTQYTAGLEYEDEAGGLNESVSDVFGSMFRQWEAGQTVDKADWLIGAGIMGPAAKKRGFTCLRDMANPGATHCLSQQPSDYSGYVPNGDPHTNSGIPNHAFYLIAAAIGGKSWEKAGKVWYAALSSPKIKRSSSFKAFAALTREAAKTLFASDAAVYAAVDKGWKDVGVA